MSGSYRRRPAGMVPNRGKGRRDAGVTEETATSARPRQNLLVLWLRDSALDSEVIAWSRWDGAGEARHMAGDEAAAPFASGLDALRAGWRLIQASPLAPHYPGAETRTAYLKYEFWFEQLIEAGDGA